MSQGLWLLTPRFSFWMSRSAPLTRSLAAQIRKEFRDLQRRLEKTMVFVTHDVAEAFLLADLIGLMKDGRLLALVHPDEFRELDEPEAREFMGSLA